MKHGDEDRVSTFIANVFHQFVAPGFSQEGVDAFMQYIGPKALEAQLRQDHFAFLATRGPDIIGLIEIRGDRHIALFFVDARFQRKGIGRELLRLALQACGRSDSPPSPISVNASPNAKKAYAQLGFEATDAEQCVNGIRFVPMVRHFQQPRDE